MSRFPLGRLGIDIGGTHVRILGEDTDGRRSEVVSAPVASSYDGLLELIAELTDTVGKPPFSAIGCGLPGSTSADVPIYVPAIPWIEGRAFADDLSRLLGGSVTLAMDGQLTLLGEVLEGAASGYRSCVLVAVGTGIGGALMIEGRIWRGHHGGAGAWGWLPAGDPGVQRALFEQVASGTALGERATALQHDWTSRALVTAARSGSEPARAELVAYGERLGRGLAAIVNLVDVEAVIFGGGLVAEVDLLTDPITSALEAAISPTTRGVAFVPAGLGPMAGVVGALRVSDAEEAAWL
ncbi:MAG TPA: ROK family protein [Solirubrobacteraceae bacterium]|jgi:glucokinase/fructokinase|nr:ROK family protein [Solirubrobacteraceae bacterium]